MGISLQAARETTVGEGGLLATRGGSDGHGGDTRPQACHWQWLIGPPSQRPPATDRSQLSRRGRRRPDSGVDPGEKAGGEWRRGECVGGWRDGGVGEKKGQGKNQYKCRQIARR